ncbi:aldehyde dehydrogenase family protein [Edaphosphingomonas haloaromaticamans]|uniref:aldehyde dehydrogenase (NAD(+)) n=1 Tax=Edaphosphingomonas haloaromaticamans TaxID=653954 RepID=A0A1S1H8Z9_9SPHN|nr:aldehyde dehydrogenase family protein [Sphingomonas haloaromaticamans]OHT18604.1 3-succinoylsemialdehyde-pyridine dehydrogenase [Sphingomonas haloaromaticamans]
METIDQIYVDGAYVTPHGTELFDLHNPATGDMIGRVRLGDETDARAAIAAAKRAFPAFSQTSKADRIAMLRRMHDAVTARADALTEAVILEYGAPASRARWMAEYAASVLADAARTLEDYDFTRRIGSATVTMEPLGVVGIITPWNSNAGFICSKLAMVVASGSTCVIKPSEMSAMQTRIVLEALREAGLPAGAFNIVNGRGDTVGAEFSTHPDIAKVSFTGSTATGRAILKAASDTFKRVTLELGGKSPMLILDDADFAEAVPFALQAGYMNSGQACIAGTRILVPEARLAEFEAAIAAGVATIKSGDPRDPATAIGPMVSEKQWQRVQSYIRRGIEEGATLLAGGEGRPEGETGGWFVRPTIFTAVRNDMAIARDEIFGPVLSIIAYGSEEEAIAIANDTSYGLHAYVASADPARARKVAGRLVAGRVIINGAPMEPLAPFGGFKHSGIGRENGVFGLEAYLEPKAVMG